MASGWARDDAVNDQIAVSTDEAIARMRARVARGGTGEAAEDCDECGEPIPEARRRAMPGVRLCVACQTAHDRAWRPSGGINRRGSKDSQLR